MTACIGADGHRVLAGRHHDGCANPETCLGCLPCPEPHCHTCKRNHAETTCPACLAMVRDHLAAVRDLSTHLHDEAVNGRRSLSSPIPGGDALVLLAPGHYRRAGDLTVDERRNDPRPVRAVVGFWVTRVTTWRGDPTPDPSLGAWLDYLDRNLHEIARGRTFPDLARDLTRLRRQIEDVLFDGDRPEVSRVPCLACGTRLFKVWETKPEADHWRCPKCGETYDRGRYDRAKHDHLASTGAERYVPVPMAVAVIGRPEQTVRAWIRRGLVETRRDPNTGRLFAWWPDVRAAHLQAKSRREERRKR